MKKYYSVYLCSLKDSIAKKYEVICTRVPFSNKLFKDIITDRIIYPFDAEKGLISDFSCEISVYEVDRYLQNMNEENILHHIEMLLTIEEENLQYYEEIKTEGQKSEEKNIRKKIKRTLRRIKKK